MEYKCMVYTVSIRDGKLLHSIIFVRNHDGKIRVENIKTSVNSYNNDVTSQQTFVTTSVEMRHEVPLQPYYKVRGCRASSANSGPNLPNVIWL